MWQKQLESEEFQTIYFNAWENDFDSNPLVALMSELKTLTNAKNKKVFKSVVEKGAVLVKNIAPSLAKSLIKKYVVDIEDIAVDVIEKATKASTEILEEEIKEFADKKKTIIEFRKELEKFVKQTDNTKPLIFIIDELDRCRPNYAVEVLEQIKHFFSVPGIVFVLSIDKNHLESAIKGYYGSERINSSEYLRRFIDLEYSIPAPSYNDYCTYLMDYYNFNDVFEKQGRFANSNFIEDGKNFLKFAVFLFSKQKLTLRQINNIFGQIRLIYSSFKNNEKYFCYTTLILMFLKTFKPEVYKSILLKELSPQELCNEFSGIFPVDDDNFHLVYICAELVHLYNNSFPGKNRTKLFSRNDSEITTSLRLKLETDSDSRFNNEPLSDCFEMLQFDQESIDYLIKRINLTESAKFN